MIIEINIVVDQYIGLLKGGSLMSVNTLGFENGKEVFCHCVIIAVSASWHGRSYPIFFSQVKVCLRGVLTSLVAVELQLRSDFLFFLHSKTDDVQYKINRLCCTCFVSNNAVVKQIPDHRQIKNALPGMNVRNIRDPKRKSQCQMR